MSYSALPDNSTFTESIVVRMEHSKGSNYRAFVYLSPSGLYRYSEPIKRQSGDRYDFDGIEERALESIQSYAESRGDEPSDRKVALKRGTLVSDESGTLYLVMLFEEC